MRGPRVFVRRWLVCFLVLGSAFLVRPEAGVAQGGAGGGLAAAEAALLEGRYEEARDRVEAWWSSEAGTADRGSFQQGLWLRARLTVDPEGAELLYRRLAVEYPGGPYSDQALLRLARGAEARGEPEVAVRYLEILIRDYPASPHRVEARAELSRVAAAPAAPAAAPEAAPAATPAPAAPAPPVTPPDTARDPAPPAPAPAPATAAPAPGTAIAGPYTIQMGAFGGRDGALNLAATLRRAGLDARVVQVEGSPLFRVRVETFPSRASAEDRLRALRERGFEALVSTDADRERAVGGS
jgi:cell division septation protein DedD